MIRIADGDRRFNLRAVAVLRDGTTGTRILVQGDTRMPFTTLPGGRVEWGETGAHTIRREMREELGEEVRVGALVATCENFFALDGRRFHEVDLVYEASLAPGSALAGLDSFPCRDEPHVRFRWAEAQRLGGLDPPLRPRFLPDLLAGRPAPPHGLHVEHRDPTWSVAGAAARVPPPDTQ